MDKFTSESLTSEMAKKISQKKARAAARALERQAEEYWKIHDRVNEKSLQTVEQKGAS